MKIHEAGRGIPGKTQMNGGRSENWPQPMSIGGGSPRSPTHGSPGRNGAKECYVRGTAKSEGSGPRSPVRQRRETDQPDAFPQSKISPRLRAALLCPSKFAHRPTGVPDLRHVADLVAVEFHHIDVIGAGALSSRRTGTALAGMGGRKHAIGAYAVALGIGREGFNLIATVRHEGQQALHPFGVSLQSADLAQRL